MTNEWDTKALTWDDDPAKRERGEKTAAMILGHCSKTLSKSLLEYGCGTGLLGFNLAPNFKHLTLADSSSGMIEMVGKKATQAGATNITPLLLDLNSAPPPDLHPDIIVSLLAFHHIDNTRQICASFFLMLNPGGQVFIADLDSEDGSFHGTGFTGHNGFDRNDLSGILSDSGFTKIGFENCFSIVKLTPSGEKKFSVFLCRAEK